jgi:transposase
MIRLFLLSERQMARISPYFPLSHGGPRVDDRRVVSGIVYVIRNGLQRRHRAATARTRLFTTASSAGAGSAFDRIFAARASDGPKPERL